MNRFVRGFLLFGCPQSQHRNLKNEFGFYGVFQGFRQAKWWFDFKLEPIFDTAPTASKNKARFKSGQSRLKNNYLAT